MKEMLEQSPDLPCSRNMEVYKIIFYERNYNVICSHVVECQSYIMAIKWATGVMNANKQIDSFSLCRKA